MADDTHASRPLLRRPGQPAPGASPSATATAALWARWRARSQQYLASREKHVAILALVAVDVAAILTEILVSLVACETGQAGGGSPDGSVGPGADPAPWVGRVLGATKVGGLVISSLFLAELAATAWAFGWSYFAASWFHCADAVVIVVSFVVDVLAHGVLEEAASLVIVLRLWRVVKIVEEMGVGAEEQMEALEAQVEALEQDKAALELRLRALEAGEAAEA